MTEDEAASKVSKAKGMKNEIFVVHLEALLDHLRSKYPDKILVIQMDNLKAHCSKLIHE